MNYHCRRFFKAALPLLVLAFLTLSAQATTVVMMTDEELIQSSRVIVQGTVKSVFSAWDDDHSAIYTYVEVIPSQYLKGDVTATRIVLKQLGGMASEGGMRVSGQPEFVRGQEVLLYLNTSLDGTLRTAQLFMGAFKVETDSATRDQYATREVDAATVDAWDRPDGQIVTNRAPLNDYLHNIQDTLQRQPVIQPDAAEQPIVAVPAEWSRKRKEAAKFKPEFVLLGSGMRWFEPDSGQPVRFYVNPANSPIANGAPNEIGRAMAAWAAQSGANVTMQNAGTTSNCGLVQDNTNTISFADCLGQLDPVSGCSGVLALTRTSWSYETKTVGGQTFNRILEADTVFNKNMNCFLSNSANMAEVTCHELGHALGLGHSTDTSALMYAIAHGGGKDATLGSDDRSGILTLYPSSGGSGGGTGGGGTGGGGTNPPIQPVSIATVSLPNATTGSFYSQTLSATGGVAPYSWGIISGLPPGMSLFPTGLLQGTPNKDGNYSVMVQVTDSRATVAVKVISLQVSSGTPTTLALITRVKIKKNKKLTIWGQNFRPDCQVLLNGLLLSPAWFQKDGSTTSVLVKSHFLPAGSNVLYVLNSGNPSPVFIF